MGHPHLPAEADDLELDYEALIGVLRGLAGERVVALVDDIAPPATTPAERGPVLSVYGRLREATEPAGGGHMFTVGDPEADGGARIRLSAGELRRASLSTFDETDFFIIRIVLGDLRLVLQDEASGPM